ncbi:spermine oxidase-like [Stylophora pistillata]|uniref:spermine oxidase-like n=1 Tax=Stylophora pistillata TaxID=50429 RepID=UPI000C045253|nr:spermine oxidase-like [Stylophora pistillata]
MPYKANVVVIGAGIAGLSAAHKLHESGLVDVCVLEASDRVGGRINTGKIGNNTVEFGASWIHGTIGNPIFDLACELNLLQKSDVDKTWINEDSRAKPKLDQSQLRWKIDDQTLEEVWNVFEKLITETEDISKVKKFCKGIPEDKRTVGNYLTQGFQDYLDSSTSDTAITKTVKHDLFLFFEERECNAVGCNSLNDLNLEDFGEYIYLDGSGYCPVPDGYNRITEALAAQLNSGCIHLNQEVTQINWGSSSESDDDAEKRYHPVKVLCANSKTFYADHVIITVSLGILKEMHSTLFSPSLPSDKIDAIRNLGFGCVGKIFLEFEKPFWPTDEYSLHLIWSNKKNTKHESTIANFPWTRHLHSMYTTRPGSNVLLVWFQGNESPQIEKTTPLELEKQCLAAINECTCLESLPPIVTVEKTQWGTNPWTRGSYTYLSNTACGSDFDTLASPLPSESPDGKEAPPLQLMFAGEATHRQFYGTVHGAYLTGVREAQRLLKYLRN